LYAFEHTHLSLLAYINTVLQVCQGENSQKYTCIFTLLLSISKVQAVLSEFSAVLHRIVLNKFIVTANSG